MRALRLFLVLLLSFHSPNSFALLRVASTERVIAVDNSPFQEEGKGYALYAGNEHHCFLTTAVDERDAQFWVENLDSDKPSFDRYHVNLHIGLVWPEVSGKINIYAAPKDFMRRLPTYLHHNKSSSLLKIVKHAVIEVWPQREVLSKGAVGICNSFMSKQNYNELRERSETHLFIPVLAPDEQSPMTVRVFSPAGTFKCNVTFPNGGEHYFEQLSPGKEAVVSTNFSLVSSGWYEVECKVKYYFTIGDSLMEHTWKKRINVTIFNEPLVRVIVDGEEKSKIVIPPQNTSYNFEVHIYSTSPITNFLLGRADGSPQEHAVDFLSHPSHEILARYRVYIPGHTTGTLTISVRNEDEKSSMVSVEVAKAEVLSLAVSPPESAVVHGRNTSFDCLVSGQPVTKIEWTRDFETLDPESNTIEISELVGELRGLQLTFLSPGYKDSGLYVCTASNQFELVQKTVELAVYSADSMHVSSTLGVKDEHELLEGLVEEDDETQHQLNMTEEKIEEDWKRWVKQHSSSFTTKVAAGATLVALLVGAFGCLIGVCICRCKKRRPKRDSVLSSGGSHQPLLHMDSRMELIPVSLCVSSEDSDGCSAFEEEWLDSVQELTTESTVVMT